MQKYANLHILIAHKSLSSASFVRKVLHSEDQECVLNVSFYVALTSSCVYD